MNPADLGLPSKFSGFRPGQEDALIAAACSDKRFFLLSMPTGGGKSLTGVGVAQLLGGRALVLTSTKGLMGQYQTDFQPIGIREIKGQNNYRCEIERPAFVTVDEGQCHSGVQCVLKANGCTYFDAVRAAAKAKLVVTNYRYWMTMNRYADPESLGKFDLLILDEAHDAPDELADFCSITIDKDELHALLDTGLPPIDEGQEVWAEWAQQWRIKCQFRLEAAKERIKEGAKYVKLVRRLTTLLRSLTELANCGQWRRGEGAAPAVFVPGQATDWVAEYKYEHQKATFGPSQAKVTGVTFSPTWAHAYAEEVLFRGIPRIVLVSATLQPTTARYLGIGPADMEFRETPSTFDARRRPFIYIPTTKVDRHMGPGEQRIWLNKIDAIIDGRLDRKGIIHTRSYERAQAIINQSRHKRILLTHGSRTARDVVEQFKRARPPIVLVSPSMETGWDFPYDECEYQIIAKVPFMDSRSKVIQARAKSDKQYLNYMTALSIVQQYGRGMRAADDQCETFIIDDHIGWFIAAAKPFFPRWFMAAYQKRVGPPPQPLSKLVRR